MMEAVDLFYDSSESLVTLINGDCFEELKLIPDDSIDLVMTSPPYAAQRNYNGANSDEYIDWIMPVFAEMKRVLKDTGNIFFNIKEHCENGQRSLYVFRLVQCLVENLGFRFVDEYIWNKTNPYPTGCQNRLKDCFERIYHFSVGKNYKFYPDNCLIRSESKYLASEKRRRNIGRHNTNNDSGMNMSRRVSGDMVRPGNVISGMTSCENIGHPAVFPIYLPAFFIKLATDENDTVLDMFCGSGTTGIAAKQLGRKFIGMEIDEDYFKLAKERINST